MAANLQESRAIPQLDITRVGGKEESSNWDRVVLAVIAIVVTIGLLYLPYFLNAY